MTEPGGTDPNASGWSDAGSQQPWGGQPADPSWGGQPADPSWGGAPPPPGYGDPTYGGQPGYGTQPGWGAPQQYGAPPGYGAPGYGAPPGFGAPGPYGYYAAPQTDGKAIGALVCAIAAWVVCPFVTAVVAVILAGQSSRDIRNSGGRLGGEGMNTAARVIAWINIGGCVLLMLFFLAAIAVAPA